MKATRQHFPFVLFIMLLRRFKLLCQLIPSLPPGIWTSEDWLGFKFSAHWGQTAVRMPYPKCSNAFPSSPINRHLCFSDEDLLMTPSKTFEAPSESTICSQRQNNVLTKILISQNLEKPTREFRATIKARPIHKFSTSLTRYAQRKGLAEGSAL